LSDGEAVKEKLREYEKLLKEHGLMPGDIDSKANKEVPNINNSMIPAAKPISESARLMSLLYFDQDSSKKVKVLTSGQGNAKFIDSALWRDLDDEDMGEIYRDEQDDDEEGEEAQQHGTAADALTLYQDPIAAVFMGAESQSLLRYHPGHAEALFLWKMHVENLEPLCKILHIPTTSQIVETVSQNPSIATKTDECLLFSIYHFAVFSMTEDDCSQHFHQSRTILLSKYSFATRQALLNASFLKTTSFTILQSLILFLMASRSIYDPHTFWILTGVAVRIAQRIGLHRDGETMDMSPFEVQMRRRLFYQLLSLDGIASQMSGTGINIITDPTWDTKPALNLNDDQIWPGMTQEQLAEHKGASDMIFCLARVCIGKYFSKTVVKFDLDPAALRNEDQADCMIAEAEREVEEKYIRYCDVVNPLHFLTLLSARSAITAMRLRVRLPKVKTNTSTPAEQRELLHFTFRILDTDTAAYTNAGLKRYMWHIRPFFAWGTWDSLIFLLTSLHKGAEGWMEQGEREEAWKRIAAMYANHAELLEAKRALQIAIGRLTVKAWDVYPPSTFGSEEPAFIGMLRAARKRKGRLREESGKVQPVPDTGTLLDMQTQPMGRLFDPSPTSDETNAEMPGFGLGHDFELDVVDWEFWDQLMREDQKQG